MSKWSLDGTIGSGVKASVERREGDGYKRSEVIGDQFALPEVAPLVAELRGLMSIPDAIMLLERDISRRLSYPNGKRDGAAMKAVRLRYPFIRPGETESTWQARERIKREDWPLVANRVRDPRREGIDIVIEALDRTDAEFFDGTVFAETLPVLIARREEA